MSNKIYIIGPVGSGKTTLAIKLSKKYNIKHYELDKVVWDDDNGNIKRDDLEIQKIFQNILKNESWIIEDIGRDRFKQGRVEASIIYYINISKLKSYYRVIKRWIKQKLGREKYNCFPDFKQLIYNISIVSSYYKKEKTLLKDLDNYKSKLKIINPKDIKKEVI